MFTGRFEVSINSNIKNQRKGLYKSRRYSIPVWNQFILCFIYELLMSISMKFETFPQCGSHLEPIQHTKLEPTSFVFYL